jgi:hypothetical protein
MDKIDHLMAKRMKIIKTAKRGKSHQNNILKNTVALFYNMEIYTF